MGIQAKLQKWGILFVLSTALAIIIIDTTILNVSFSKIVEELHTDIQSLQWVITAYSLTLAALTITGGRLGDFFGRKLMFMVGAFIFAVGSMLASVADTVPILILGEAIIEGIGAALMMPATASLLLSNYQGRDRALAFGIWGGIAAAAAALGPIVGGYLTLNYSWRWGFRINIFVVILLLFGSLLIPEAKDQEEKAELDWIGVLLSGIGLTSLIFGIIEASRYGWWTAKEVFSFGGVTLSIANNLSIVPVALSLGIVLLCIFVLWELHMEAAHRTPLVSMKLFRNRQFNSGVVTTMVTSLAQSGLIFSLPIFLQGVRGYNALQTGFSLLPMSIAILFSAPLSAILSKKINPKYMIQAGLLLDCLAFIVLRQSLNVNSSALELAPALMLFGAGMGLFMAQVSNITLSAVSVEQAGEASGVNNTMRQVGQSFGSAIIGSILLTALTTYLTTGITNSSIIPAQFKSTITQGLTKNVSNVEFGNANAGHSQLPPQIAQEIKAVSKQATVDANKQIFLWGAGFALMAFLVSMTLPKKIVEVRGKMSGAPAGH
jgi:EmrB/QacA subfamily drug resistance transporter